MNTSTCIYEALPKSEGGLGVLNLRRQNEALLLKNWYKFMNREDVPWVQLVWEKYYPNHKVPSHIKKGSFWWRDILKLLDNFKGMATVLIHDGKTCLFWDDMWMDKIPKIHYPELYAFTMNKTVTVSKVKPLPHLHQLFHVPLSEEAFHQYIELQERLDSLPAIGGLDTWTYTWGNTTFSVANAYKVLTRTREIHPAFGWVWKSCCQPNHKVFFWLLLIDRLNTRGLLKRKHMELQSYDCVQCQCAVEESLQHLFLDCTFARDCWALLHLTVSDPLDPFKTLESFRQQLGVPFFMEVVILMSWCIWSSRNDQIFRNIAPQVDSCKATFRRSFALMLHRARSKYFPAIEQWLESVL